MSPNKKKRPVLASESVVKRGNFVFRMISVASKKRTYALLISAPSGVEEMLRGGPRVRGTAKLNPSDTWDIEEGQKVAINRALAKVERRVTVAMRKKAKQISGIMSGVKIPVPGKTEETHKKRGRPKKVETSGKSENPVTE